MRDCLGWEIKKGDWIVYPGAGNSAAEYGMILAGVESVTPTFLRVKRLSISYDHKYEGTIEVETKVNVGYKAVTLKASTRLTKVYPPPKMIEVFMKPEKHRNLVSKWLHGRTEINWNTLQMDAMRE